MLASLLALAATAGLLATSPLQAQVAAAPARFRSAEAIVAGQRFNYVRGGRGETVVLLHGWPEIWAEWRRS